MENKKKKIKVGMIAAMPFPPQKACGIRVKNEISVIKKDVNVRLYCAPPGKRREKADGYEIFRTEHVLDTTDYYKYYSWKKKLAVDFNLVRLIARDIRQGKIDVLHAHTGEGLFISF
jgi:hypothetical protein